MTEERAPYAVPTPQPQTCQQDDTRWLALAIRRGLLVIVKAIEAKYPDAVKQERKAA